MTEDQRASLEEQIDQWRNYLRRRQAIHSVDVAELEDHLREQVTNLTDAGLALDEAFLVAVKRMGNLDALSREFAREHSDRLWKQLVVVPSNSDETRVSARKEALVAVCLAIAAAVFIKIPSLFGLDFGDDADLPFYARNASLFVLPLLVGYFVWKRQPGNQTIVRLALGFGIAVLFANIYPFVAEADGSPGSTELLTAVHLPIALWLLVGVAYAGSRWREVSGRMDFIRFTGELLIYYALIALGGGVLTAFLAMTFNMIGIDVEPFMESWWMPCGVVGAVLIASWLVEAKQSVIENMAPVLTRIFTPLFVGLLITFLTALAVTGRGISIEREVLIAFDLLLLVVLGLLLYSVSARDQAQPPNTFDVLQVVLVVSALLADSVALWAIGARISEFGLSPNRAAALGMNIILLVNLAWSAALYVRFLRGRGAFNALERWQTNYLPVFAAWAAIVVIVFPPLFRYI